MLTTVFFDLFLTVTCLVGPGVVYTPPKGWTLEKVQTKGQIDACLSADMCYSVHYPKYEDNTVTLRRAVQEGEAVKAPQDCTMIEVKRTPQKE